MEDRAQPLILVVEDDELLRLHAADLLEAHGFAVVKAQNADEALKVLEQRNDVRLLFTDIQMPGALDGMGFGAPGSRPPAQRPVDHYVRPNGTHSRRDS